MATAALVRDVFGSDSDTDDARDAREASTEARDAIESVPARAPFTSSLELDDDDDDADDDANDARRVESTPLHIELASDARADARETEETAQIAKLSNIFGVDARAFDASTREEKTITIVDADGVERVHARDENIIRWRIDPRSGKPESNARFVKWSDGSTHLVVGDEFLVAPRARRLQVLSNSMTTTTTPMTTRTTRDALNRRLYTSNSRRTRARTRERRKKRHRLRNYPTFSASTRARSTRRRAKKKRSPSSMRTVSNACTRGMKTSFDGGSIRGAENRNRTRDL